MQHYHQALSTAATPTTRDDLLSDGVFFRHFLLFIYDICIPMQTQDAGADMWALHLNHLREIALQRHRRAGHEPYAYITWSICELDMYVQRVGGMIWVQTLRTCLIFRPVRRVHLLRQLTFYGYILSRRLGTHASLAAAIASFCITCCLHFINSYRALIASWMLF